MPTCLRTWLLITLKNINYYGYDQKYCFLYLRPTQKKMNDLNLNLYQITTSKIDKGSTLHHFSCSIVFLIYLLIFLFSSHLYSNSHLVLFKDIPIQKIIDTDWGHISFMILYVWNLDCFSLSSKIFGFFFYYHVIILLFAYSFIIYLLRVFYSHDS